MSKGKMTSVEVNEAKRIHEQMIDLGWRRSISSGQDIERSEIAELMIQILHQKRNSVLRMRKGQGATIVVVIMINL